MERAVLRVVAIQPAGTRESLEQTFSKFLRLDCAAGDAAADTIRGYMAACRMWLASWCQVQEIDPHTATAEHVRAYRRHLVEVNYTPGTIAHRLAVLRRFYTALVWCGVRKDNPAAGVKPPREKSSPEERVRFVEVRMLERLFEAVPGDTLAGLRDMSMLALMALHGLRGVEVHRADVQDLELGVDPARLLVHGKTGERTVYLRRDVASTLRRYLAKRLRAGLPTGQADPLFVSLSNRAYGNRISRRGIRKITDGHLRSVG